MEPTITKKRPQPNKSIFLLTLLIFSTYYNGQTKISEPMMFPIAIGTIEQPVSSIIRQTSIYDNVHCGLRDKAGNLWFGTTGAGIYRYDGKSFTNYTTKDGINSNNIWSIHEDKNGTILFGSDAGIFQYDGKSFTNLTESSELRNTSIWSFCEDKTGKLWIATGDSGVYNYDGKSFSKFLSADITNNSNLSLNYISDISEDKSGNIWFASWNNEGLSRFDGKSLTKFLYAENVSDYMVHCILIDKTGYIWFGTRNNGVFRYDTLLLARAGSDGHDEIGQGNSITNYTEEEGFASRGISTMLEDKNGNIWFGTENRGVFCYDGKSFTNFTTDDGLSNNSVFSIVEDNEGFIWFGTRNVGLCRYDARLTDAVVQGNLFTDFSDKLN